MQTSCTILTAALPEVAVSFDPLGRLQKEALPLTAAANATPKHGRLSAFPDIYTCSSRVVAWYETVAVSSLTNRACSSFTLMIATCRATPWPGRGPPWAMVRSSPAVCSVNALGHVICLGQSLDPGASAGMRPIRCRTGPGSPGLLPVGGDWALDEVSVGFAFGRGQDRLAWHGRGPACPSMLQMASRSSLTRRRCWGSGCGFDDLAELVVQRFDAVDTRYEYFTPEALRQWAADLRVDDEVALEATGNGDAIAKLLTPIVGRVVVSNPSKTRAIAGAKVETDKVDARILAPLLAAGFLPPVWLSDDRTRALRRQVTRRAHLVRQRTRIKTRSMRSWRATWPRSLAHV